MKRKAELQGGVYNFLGKQKTVNAPIKWKSSAKHPVAFLAYITKEEMDILIQKNIYGSLKGKPNKGPFGLPSLQGSGGGAGGGDGGGDGGSGGASGPGGSEGFDSDTGPSGPSGPGGSEGFDSQTGPSGVAGVAGMGNFDDFGAPTAQSLDAFAASQQQATAPEEEESKSARNSKMGRIAYSMSLANPTRSGFEKAVGFMTSPISSVVATAVDVNVRGVTAPTDYSQAQTSVQSSALGTKGSESGDEFLDNLYKKQFKKAYGGIVSI